MKRGGPRHPKTKRLAKALGTSTVHAVGVLEVLWHMTAEVAPSGAIGRHFTDEELADELEWQGDAATLVEALVETEWFDRVPGRDRLAIHDWAEHADDTVHAKLARGHRLFADGTIPKTKKLSKDERAEVEAALEEKRREFEAKMRDWKARESTPETPSEPDSSGSGGIRPPIGRRAAAVRQPIGSLPEPEPRPEPTTTPGRRRPPDGPGGSVVVGGDPWDETPDGDDAESAPAPEPPPPKARARSSTRDRIIDRGELADPESVRALVAERLGVPPDRVDDDLVAGGQRLARYVLEQHSVKSPVALWLKLFDARQFPDADRPSSEGDAFSRSLAERTQKLFEEQERRRAEAVSPEEAAANLEAIRGRLRKRPAEQPEPERSGVA